MGTDRFNLLSEGETYLWALRHARKVNFDEARLQEIKTAFSENGG